MIGTTVDHAKSFARRGLRVAGMDAGNAQDFVDMAEIATCVAPVMKGAYGLAASTKVGVKTASALRGAVHEIKSAARFGIDALEDYAQFKARCPQPAYARSRTFDRSYAAPKRAHSSIFFQEKSSHFESQRFSQSSKASAAPRAQQAPAAAVENPLYKKPVTAYDFKDYICEIESVSGLQIPSEQKAYLSQMLRVL